jgi:hypothetical protein
MISPNQVCACVKLILTRTYASDVCMHFLARANTNGVASALRRRHTSWRVLDVFVLMRQNSLSALLVLAVQVLSWGAIARRRSDASGH